jgi:hypothetical protein
MTLRLVFTYLGSNTLGHERSCLGSRNTGIRADESIKEACSIATRVAATYIEDNL